MTNFDKQLKSELLRLFARKRTYIGFGAFFATEILLLSLLHLPKVKASIQKLIEESGYPFDQYFSGLTLAFMTLLWTVFLLGALYLSLIGGDVVSKEVEEGTMRMILCRPVTRFQILAVKYCAVLIYTATLLVFIAATALASGMISNGPGGLFIFAPLERVFAMYDFHAGILRYLAALPLLALSLSTITTLAFTLSCFNMKPAAATIVTLSFFFLNSILQNIPYLETLRGWFITSRMTCWVEVFTYQVPWEHMLENYAWLMGINATLFVIAWAHFEGRDFKS